MASVPRLYEKIYARVLDNVRRGIGGAGSGSSPGPSGSASDWAERGDRRPAGAAGARARSARLADRLVFAKLRARTGGRIRFFISGGAPLSPDIARFFFAAGMPILEGYGLTETSPVIAVNTFEHHQARHGRPADPRGRDPDRPGRRDPDPRPERHEGLLQQARGHGRGARRRRAGSTPATSACSTRTASSASPTGRRT